MTRAWKQNVIVSHGGKHGQAARTYRKGQAVPPDANRVIPDSVLGATTEKVAPDPAPAAGPQAAPEKPQELPQEAQAPARDETPSPPPEATRAPEPEPPAPPPPPPEPTPELEEEEELEEEPEPELEPEELELPTSRRAVRLLRVAELEQVAAHLGIHVDEDARGRSDTMRELIIAKLEL